MANTDDEKTVINVKGVLKKAWDRAKIAADRNEENLGSWISRAVNHLADAEAGPREFPPGVNPPANPDTHPSGALILANARLDQLFAMMRGISEISTATARPPPKALVSRIYSLADDWTRAQKGLPPKSPRVLRLANGKDPHENGKASTFEALPSAETLPF